MASHDVDKRLTQRRFIHRIEEAQRERQVENLVMAKGFIHLPQRFLRQRQRRLRAIMVVGGGHRGIRLRDVQAFGVARQPARRRMAEQIVNVDFDLMQAQQATDHPGSDQRMAAAIEEVFIQGHFRRHQRLTELLQNQRCNAFVRVAVRRRRGHRREAASAAGKATAIRCPARNALNCSSRKGATWGDRRGSVTSSSVSVSASGKPSSSASSNSVCSGGSNRRSV